MSKQPGEQSACGGTVVDFKANKYVICYNDGTTASLTKTAPMKVLSPVRVEAITAAATTVDSALATIVVERAVGSASEAVGAPAESPLQLSSVLTGPDQKAEPTTASTETRVLPAVQKTPERYSGATIDLEINKDDI